MKARNQRTLALALLATATFVWAAIYKFDVPAEEMAWLLLYCTIGVAVMAVLAALCVALVVVGRKFLRHLRERQG
jgi:membrane protein implicated in regulation of membrane protease activity